jgi:mono/diheme cytochrome c family protein
MTRSFGIAVVSIASILAVGAAVQGPTAADGVRDGKAVFIENRCNSCHTVKAAGIEKKKAAEPAEAKSSSKKTPPDLSGVGLERKADWIAKFLMKEETIKGDKHEKRFKGPEADLKLVSAWLETQKTKPAKK